MERARAARSRSSGRDVTIATSVGIAFSDQGMVSAQDAEELLRNADAAMYMAKESGKGHYRIFQPEMHAKALARLELKTDLQRALDARRVHAALPADHGPRPGRHGRHGGARALGAPRRAARCRRSSSSRCWRTPG